MQLTTAIQKANHITVIFVQKLFNLKDNQQILLNLFMEDKKATIAILVLKHFL